MKNPSLVRGIVFIHALLNSMRALQPWMCTHALECFQIKNHPCISSFLLLLLFFKTTSRYPELPTSTFSIQENENNFVKFSMTDKYFCWLCGNIFIVLYPKYISDPATGNAGFWLSGLVAKVTLLSRIITFVLDLLQFVCTWGKKKLKDATVQQVGFFFFFFWLHCACILDSLSVFSLSIFRLL